MYNYSIDFGRIVTLLTPIPLRRPRMYAYSQLLVSGVVALKNRFGKYVTDTQERISCSSQVCLLRARLNKVFDEEQKRITIEDGSRKPLTYIYQRGNDDIQFVSLRNTGNLLYVPKRGLTGDCDFIVKLNGVSLNTSTTAYDNTADNRNRMRAIIEAYKTAGKQYVIL